MVQQRRSGAGIGLGLAALAGLGVAIAAAAGRNGGGTGNQAVPSGSISSIAVSQNGGSGRPVRHPGLMPGQEVGLTERALPVAVLSQDLAKDLGDTVTVGFSVTFATRDAQRNLINWPYQVAAYLIRVSDNLVVDQLSTSAVFAPGTINPNPAGDLTIDPSKVNQGDTLGVLVQLTAPPSKADGTPVSFTPDSSWLLLSSVTAQDLVKITCPTPGPRAYIPHNAQQFAWTAFEWNDNECTWRQQPVFSFDNSDFRFPTPCGYHSMASQVLRWLGSSAPSNLVALVNVLSQAVSDWQARGMGPCPSPKTGPFTVGDAVWWITTVGDFPGVIEAVLPNNFFRVSLVANNVFDLLGDDLEHR